MHFHYVLSMGVVFGMMGGTYYWMGKVTGYQYPETLGKIHFWLMFIGVNMAPKNLAWCWNNYLELLSYNFIENDNKQNLKNFNSQSAGAKEWRIRNSLTRWRNSQYILKNYYHSAPQRINVKEIWYILGFFESNGSISIYKEGKYIRAELNITLIKDDIKLLYWIKSIIGKGSVSKVKYNRTINNYVRYKLRSTVWLREVFFKWFEEYPCLTNNKNKYLEWSKVCISTKKYVEKDIIFNSVKDLSYSFDYLNNLPHVKDWIVGFIEGDGSFYIVKEINRVEFYISQKQEKQLLENIGKIMGLSGKNSVSIKNNGQCILTAVSLKDIQAVVNFMCNPERIRLKGMKKVKFLLWLKELRRNPRYSGIKVPDKY